MSKLEKAVKEARLERAVEAALAKVPLYAYELSSVIGESDKDIADAVARLAATDRVIVSAPGCRFELSLEISPLIGR